MGDNKQYTIQLKGTAYTFAPLDPEDIERLGVVSTMGAGHLKTAKALFRVLSHSAGPSQWDEITDRYVVGDILLKDLTGLFKKLTEKHAKDSAPADDAE